MQADTVQPRSLPLPCSPGSMPVEGFAAQLIAALEEAQAAASQPKPPHLLAQAAYEKLQFDFPVSDLALGRW